MAAGRRTLAAIAAAVAVLVGDGAILSRPVSGQTAGWSNQDIGSPTIAGSAVISGSSATITAGGSDIGGTSDQFHFVYQQITGDVDIRARVDSITDASSWSKAGVMIRSALTPDAAHGFALVSVGRGTAFQRRPQTGGLTSRRSGPGAAPPEWVRLVRQGTTLGAYVSRDGVTWTLISQDTIQIPATAYVGLAVTSHNVSAATTAAISQISIVPLGLPAGQQDGDIGAPAITGGATYSSGTYQIRAGGTDIGGTSDQFHYVYQPVTGDVDVAVRIGSVSFADKWSRAGVMIRETLSANSAHAAMLLSARRGYAFQRRSLTGGTSDSTSGGNGTPPGWARLQRAGALITAYSSTDGQHWTIVGSDSISMAETVYVGVAATSDNAGAATTVIADSFTLSQAVSNQPPAVSITSPAPGDSFTAPATIAVNATASDPENQLTKVELYNGATLLGTDTAAPYAFSWSSVPAGIYSLTAVAYDAGGLNTRSAAVSVTVSAANQAPSVSLTSPANGASFSAPATITINATALDPENQLTKVEFYNGATLLGTDTAAPYAFSWSSVAAGTYSLTAVAYDAGGLNTRSAAVSVTVSPPSQPPPTGVIFTASSDHATVTSYRVDVFAAGADTTTATPVATMDAGKPTPDVNNNITVSAPSFFSALAPGNYQLTVSAISPGGVGRSAPLAFTR